MMQSAKLFAVPLEVINEPGTSSQSDFAGDIQARAKLG